MVFSSTLFLFLFLPLVLAGYYNPFCKTRRFRNIWLLLASLGFYAWGEPLFVFVMILSIIVNWLLVLAMEKHDDKKMRKAFLRAAVIFDVAILFVFKYASFAVKSIGPLLHNGTAPLNIALPIGISFFTFQIMSYVFDVYYGTARPHRSPVNTALYISMFPQLIAGPIVRYETVAGEIDGRQEQSHDFVDGMLRFVMGLGKKLLLANYAGFIADSIFALNGTLSVSAAWLGAVAYTLQIYFDFSGYSDMAIGLGGMFGFHFPENFNYPYTAVSISDFWRRWHISLSTWFRDYVYIPLGGSRRGTGRRIGNLFVVWFLTGFWHGANWTFMVWGLFYFVLLLIESLAQRRTMKSCPRPVARVYTLFFVIIGWVLFRSDSLSRAGQYLSAMFGFGATAFTDETFSLFFSNGKWILLAGAVLSTPAAPAIRKRFGDSRVYGALAPLFTMALFTLSVLAAIKSTYNPFVYFNF
jgi:D-alanyl-lipoteichoic acid acyltransferase DltB (MBOAT superfamily)